METEKGTCDGEVEERQRGKRDINDFNEGS